MPETRIAIPDANKTLSKPLSKYTFKKYPTKIKIDVIHNHFK